MKLKITTDGTPIGTKIVNTVTREQLEKCIAANITMRPEGVRAEVVLLVTDNLEFDGNFEVFKTVEGTEQQVKTDSPTIGSKEHYELLAQFEKNFSHMRLDREQDKSLWKIGQVYEDGETNALYTAYILGYMHGRLI